MLRNPTYTGIGPRFWQSMDMLSSEITAWGTPNCGKGQPGQTGHTGHPAARGAIHERTGGGAGMSSAELDLAGRVVEIVRRVAGAEAEAEVDRRPHGAGADPVRQLAHPPERRGRDHHGAAAAARRRADGRRRHHRSRRRRAHRPRRAHARGRPALPARSGVGRPRAAGAGRARRRVGRDDRAGVARRSAPTGYGRSSTPPAAWRPPATAAPCTGRPASPTPAGRR